MKLLSALLFAALTCSVSAQQEQSVTLAEKWNLTDPTFTYGSNTFNLTFPVTDYITTGMAQFSLWTAPGCQSDNGTSLAGNNAWNRTALVENQELAKGLRSENGNFTGRAATVVTTFNPQTISSSIIYTNTSTDGQASAEIRFCMRFGLWTTESMGVNTPVEVNFRETLITLTVELTGGFAIGAINIEPKDRLVRTANQAYLVRGYECTETSFGELTANETSRPRNQGEIISVCVTPESEAQSDGIFMRSIDEFDFTRTTGNILQAAVNNGQQADNLLTTYDPAACRGSKVCRFSTILFAQFFATAGPVAGQGTATMQFGNSTAPRRQLRTERERDLQEEDAAGSSEFDLNFEVAQAESRTDSGAESTMKGAVTTMAAIVAVVALL